MPTTFDSHFARSAFPKLLDQFGESIVYVPSSGGSRPITAIIERDPPAILNAAGNTVLPSFTVRVYNSCRSGISSKELNSGTDQLKFVRKIGDVQPATFSVMHLISSDAGVTHLAVI
jgi:hypothetical protein